jgi:hypothetical protein
MYNYIFISVTNITNCKCTDIIIKGVYIIDVDTLFQSLLFKTISSQYQYHLVFRVNKV